MFEWLTNNENLLWWMLAISLFSFMATLIVLPIILLKIPDDYFLSPERRGKHWQGSKSLLRVLMILSKNLLGLVFILLGIAMLILPGQGLLTILIGLILIDFPGKYAAERWIVRRPAVLKGINWIRQKARRGNLIVDR